jgi:hypothetical protein
VKGRSFGSGSRTALASGKRLREKNLSFVLTLSHNHGGFRIRSVAQGSAPCYQPWVVLSVLG